MKLNGTRYFYIRNVQNDIVGLTDPNGTVVVRYQYNAWGKLLSITGSLDGTIGVKNPFRYRGYYYDTETGMYYLKNRYYDPEIRRFVCADGFTSTGVGDLQKNTYLYCLNNPINMADYNGCFAVSLGTGLLFAAACAVVTYQSNSPSVQVKSRNVVNYIVNTVSRAVKTVFAPSNVLRDIWTNEDYQDAIKIKLDKSFSKVKTIPWYQGETQIHHIVAQNAQNQHADAARKVLYGAGLHTEISQNKVELSRGLHQRLHTKIYYEWIDMEMKSVAGQGEDAIKAKLSSIGVILQAWDYMVFDVRCF